MNQEIKDMKVGELLAVAALVSPNKNEAHPYQVNSNYFIRTVTHNYTGKLTAVFKDELVLADVSWIADSGRWMQALESPDNLDEVEPFPQGEVVIGRGAIIDATLYPFVLPRKQK